MALINRFRSRTPVKPVPVEDTAKAPDIIEESSVSNISNSDVSRQKQERVLNAKIEIHQKLLEVINLQLLDKVQRDQLRNQVAPIVNEEIQARGLAFNRHEADDFVDEVIDEMVGLGPLETLLKDDSISDILINTHTKIFVERHGKLELSPVRFKDEPHLLRIINKMVSAVGRRVDESSPLCDARLADGSRLNVAVRPITVDGPQVSIRKFSKNKLSLDKLVEYEALRSPMAEILSKAAWGKITIIISGGTGSGKTTMLNALSAHISGDERLITIEDAAELKLQQQHVVRMETRPPNLEGRGEIRQRELVKNALRMRPDRIILGEVRGEEAFDMLQAMNTGHEGSMATVHANSPREALSRLEQMITMAGYAMTQESIRSQIVAAIGLIVQVQRLSDGSRKITSISEITGLESGTVQMQEIFKFNRLSTAHDGRIIGEFRATGVRPKFAADLVTRGVVFPTTYFDPNKAL